MDFASLFRLSRIFPSLRPKVEYETEFSEEDLVSPKLLGIDSKKERNGFHKEGNMRERRNKEAKSMEQQVDDELEIQDLVP
jgi:hypothetical protein